jgi:hypothetical protein
MDLVTTVGIGGTILQDPRPMILFKDGWACREMNFVVRGLDEATHRAMFPKAWV